MSRTMIEQRLCDKTHRGGMSAEATQTRTFVVDKDEFRMDFCDFHAEKFDQEMRALTEHAERIGRQKAATSRSGTKRRHRATRKNDNVDTNTLRAWGRENGFEVADRGMIPIALREAYAAAHH